VRLLSFGESEGVRAQQRDDIIGFCFGLSAILSPNRDKTQAGESLLPVAATA
jgi:hypothetical protein